MATPISIKRMRKERLTLEKPNPNYFVLFKDDDLLSLDAYVYGAPDSLYAHKLLKVHIDIPEKYPFSPPKVKFIQHGHGRIHPNLYVDGKVCLSILGTWPGEPWALAMTVETVLITIRSLLDNKPFMHEPGGKDDPCFNQWVEYAGWKLHLLDHLERETEPVFQAFLHHYMQKSGANILRELEQQAAKNRSISQLSNRYDRTVVSIDYPALKEQLSTRIIKADGELVRLKLAAPHGYDVLQALQRLTAAASPAKSEVATATVEVKSITSTAPELAPRQSRLYFQPNVQEQRKVSPAKRQAQSDSAVADHSPHKKQKPIEAGVIDLT